MRIRRSVLLTFVGLVSSTVIVQAAGAVAPPPPPSMHHMGPVQPVPANVVVRTTASLPGSTYPWVMPVGITFGNLPRSAEPKVTSSLPATTYPWVQVIWPRRGGPAVVAVPAAVPGVAASGAQPAWTIFGAAPPGSFL